MTGSSSVDLNILRTRLDALARELGVVVANAAPTAKLGQERAFTVAIADAAGGIAAIDHPLQLGSVAQTVERILDYFEFDLKDGDVVVTNDPYGGGTRVPEVALLAPFLVGGQRIASLVVRVWLPDVAGKLSGNALPTATEIWAEGVPLTPLKIQRVGRPARDAVSTVLLNGRHPGLAQETLNIAQAALRLGLTRLGELVDVHGTSMLTGALAYAQDYAEGLARAAIRSWDDGTFQAERALPADPSGDAPAMIRVVALVAGDGLTLDYTATDDQRPSFVNASLGTTSSAAVQAVVALLGERVPPNGGLLRAVSVLTRPASVAHAVRPAPVGWGPAHCGNEVASATVAALADAAGGTVPALESPRPLLVSRPSGAREETMDLGRWAVPAGGAHRGGDGWGLPIMATRASLPSVEQWESDHGTRIASMEYVADTAGAGQWAGAPAIETTIELPADRCYTLWAAPVSPDAVGREGGCIGRAGELAFHIDGQWQTSPAVVVDEHIDADRVRVRLPGGIGWGPPAARDHDAVRIDVREGLISSTTARDIYRLPEE